MLALNLIINSLLCESSVYLKHTFDIAKGRLWGIEKFQNTGIHNNASGDPKERKAGGN